MRTSAEAAYDAQLIAALQSAAEHNNATIARLTAERDALRAALEGIAANFARPEKGLTDFGERQHYLHIACRLRDKARATLADNLTPRQETAD